MKPKNTATVLALFDLGTICGRKLLTGVFAYANEGHPCNIRILQDKKRLEKRDLQAFEEGGIDGIITHLPTKDWPYTALALSPIRSVIITKPQSLRISASRSNLFLWIDNEKIGREAAKYLFSRGSFSSFGYYTTYPALYWSQRREFSFKKELHRLKRSCETLYDRHGTLPSQELMDYLRRLPKPAAIMGSSDEDAVTLLEACRAMELSVPEQVSVLGVDNDEFLCNLAQPTLSSIELDHTGVGYAAARALDSLLAGQVLSSCYLELENVVLRLVERSSTRTIPPTGYLIREALDFIHKHACSGISPRDVACHLGVSRRLIDLRFQQIQKSTVLAHILETRLTEVRNRLEKTSEPLGRIATNCGFGTLARLSSVFRARYGKTMSEWRAEAAASRHAHDMKPSPAEPAKST